MRDRCYNTNRSQYTDYGGRGIVVCQEWLDDFMNFYNWAIDNGYKDGLTIDRINNDGNYEPDNCRWVDSKTQQRNRRNNRNFTYQGETHCLKEWCEILGLRYNTVVNRIHKSHWTIEQALELEKRHNKHYTINGESHRLIDWCRILNLNYKLVHCRICRGLSIEKALELEGK